MESKITPKNRKFIFKYFLSLDDKAKFTKRNEKLRVRTVSDNSRRKYSHQYFFVFHKQEYIIFPII